MSTMKKKKFIESVISQLESISSQKEDEKETGLVPVEELFFFFPDWPQQTKFDNTTCLCSADLICWRLMDVTDSWIISHFFI